MIRENIRYFTFVLCFVLTCAGCKSGSYVSKQKVSITSDPSGASVIVDGESIGTTPMVATLDRNDSYDIIFRREHFREGHGFLASEDVKHFVQFGLLADAGYYNKLGPNPLHVELEPLLVPDSRGVDTYAEFASRVLEADGMLESGQISKEEHVYIVERLVKFFQ